MSSSKPYYEEPGCVIYHGDNREVMAEFEPDSVDAVVTDPPAGIAFMNREWDRDKGGRDRWIEWMAGIAAECLRVLKPGAHALVWSLPRTSHWTAMAWENAGFEPRDRIAHCFGSGFPKSLDVSKQLDKAAGQVGTRGDYISRDHAIKRKPGNERMHEGYQRPWRDDPEAEDRNARLYIPATDEAKQWNGWGTGLKPAIEDWWLFRKPLEQGLTVAQNVLKWGTGALNIDGCRVGIDKSDDIHSKNPHTINQATNEVYGAFKAGSEYQVPQGRWPANVIIDGSDEVVSLFPVSNGRNGKTIRASDIGYHGGGGGSESAGYQDIGSAARFFYTAKSSNSDRGNRVEPAAPLFGVTEPEEFRNTHPTVKPTALMEYLIKLVTPPDGVLLDCFLGSGSTLVAAKRLGIRAIGIESDEDSCATAVRRVHQKSSSRYLTSKSLGSTLGGR